MWKEKEKKTKKNRNAGKALRWKPAQGRDGGRVVEKYQYNPFGMSPKVKEVPTGYSSGVRTKKVPSPKKKEGRFGLRGTRTYRRKDWMQNSKKEKKVGSFKRKKGRT